MKAIIQKIVQELMVGEEQAKRVVEKALEGGETTQEDLQKWLELRFLPNIVYIDEVGYTQMLVDALKIVTTTAATDYGTSRQRDLGQLWGDMTRGYLAEYALSEFLHKNWGVASQLDHEKGEVVDFLSSDIRSVSFPSESFRPSKLKISIKGSKWNGIWLDIPGGQFSHSDIFVFVKVGATRDHLFSYFKQISVFRDKVLRRGLELGVIDPASAEMVYEALPSFSRIPAYVVGFVTSRMNYTDLPYKGKRGRVNFTITEWRGHFRESDIGRIKEREGITGSVKFSGIGTFSGGERYLFNTGCLLWSRQDWEKEIISQI
jgi:hypothetical protein